MKTVTINKPVNLNLLTEELFEAFPEWRQLDSRGRYVTDVIITETEVIFPDSTDAREVEKIMDKHDQSKDSKNQAKEKLRQAKRESAKNKLLALGLDDEEIEVLLTS